MAEASQTPAPGQGRPVNIQLLRAQYEVLRRQQRTQVHLMVFPTGGTMPAPTESMINAVWINKERKSSLSPDETDSEVEELLEEVGRSCPQTLECPWYTHLEMQRSIQSVHQEASHQMQSKGQLVGSEQRLPPDGDPHLWGNHQKAQQGTQIPETSECQSQASSPQTKTTDSSFKAGVPGLPPMRNGYRTGKQVHYPFPQRKAPRISQTARNLGLYGPA